MPSLPRIFVNIASYRDPECQWTVKDLFKKAKHPERIFVGICWQIDEQEDVHCFTEPYERPDQVREIRVDWKEAEGVCWARSKVQGLWEGEEYTLQIDSHMRFVEHWDEKCLEEVAACPSAKAVITGSIAKYTPPDTLQENPMPSVLSAGFFDASGNWRARGAVLKRIPPRPLNAAFISAGFMFSSSDLIREVPYDPYMYFDQEEITLALRLYTHGWDVFSARRPVVYHHYITAKDTSRPLHWNDLLQAKLNAKYATLRERGLRRMNHLTGHASTTDENALEELETYGLGRARNQDDFQAYAGIDFRRKQVSEKAVRAQFIEGLAELLDRRIFVPELDDNTKQPPASYVPTLA